MAHLARTAGAITIALLALLASCSDDVTLAPEVEKPTTPDAGKPPEDASSYYDVAACKACLATTCTPERVRCFSVAGCVAISNCAARNNCDQECINKLCYFVQTGFGRREYQALSTCEFEASCGTCRDLCGASPLCVLQSSPSSAPPPAAATSCGGCMREKCSTQVKACEPGSACAAYFACANPCPEPRTKCVDDCNAAHAAGRADAQALLDCSNETCKGSCVY